MSELNFFDLETSKSKVRVKRDALPEEPLIVNSEGQNPIAHEAHLQELDNLQQEADGLQHGLQDALPEQSNRPPAKR